MCVLNCFIEFDIDGDIMFDNCGYSSPPPLPPFRHWLRHMAAVPKGYLRYQVLELLNEKPMSGSEIMNEIEKRTGGCWKPSPGSVYPLLAWLQDNGYVREVPVEESGVKRYTLTDNPHGQKIPSPAVYWPVLDEANPAGKGRGNPRGF